ncbi:MAG: 2-isopropylmalate synthase, partial [Bifidobacterium crudilactis]|nr:2-isopropylmalate synthase [Bifidobacterium crudilactis]
SERHPYVGSFVFTAFSGSHQDAIKKGLEARQQAALRDNADIDNYLWLVPYLPIDPKDVGGSYEAIIRVNSQSGKGGMAYLLKTNHHIDLPKRLQVEFDRIVQHFADDTKREVRDEDIWRLFKDEYLPVEEGGSTAAAGAVADKADSSLSQWGRLKLLKVSVSSGEDGSDTVLKARVLDRGLTGHDAPEERQIEGTGNGPVAAFLNALSALDLTISVEDYVEHAMTAGSDALAASYVECKVGEPAQERVIWGVGIDSSVITSTLKAIISAVNRFER